MVRRTLAKAGIVLSLALASTAAHAQGVVAITDGTFVVDDARNNSLSLSGTQGFQFDGSVSLGSAPFEAIEQCWVPECPPGSVVSLSDSWAGGDVFGVVRFRGKTYDDAGSLNSDASMFVAVSGSVTMPPMSDGPVTVTVPVDYGGTFSFGLNGPRPQSIPVLGGGTATLTLVPLVEDPNFWHIQQIVFDFTRVEQRR